MLLAEFDPNPCAVINPDIIHKRVENFPETVVSVFSHQLFASVAALLEGDVIAETHDADGVWPVYETVYHGKRFGFCKARVGAPACVGQFEDIIAMGAGRILLLGNCGVLDKRIEDCGIIIPTRAIRDEGTSYHYAPAGDFIEVNTRYIPEFTEVLREFGYPYVQGVTWTTDAFYRETPEKVRRRREQGCVCVEMEAAAVAAMAQFRGKEAFIFFYAGDSLDGDGWDARSLSGHAKIDEKDRVAYLALETARRIALEKQQREV